MPMSQGFQEQEKKHQEDQDRKHQEKLQAETKVYWHHAREGQIANLGEERYSGDRLVAPERPVRFFEHTYETQDAAIAEFIERSDSFKTRTVLFCGTGEEGRLKARQLTAEQTQRKTVRVHESEIDVTIPTVKDVVDAPTEINQAV